jgi:nucleoside-diphosphate-sugar epimerase
VAVLVTGGCGLVGTSLVHRLLAEREAEVVVVDLSPPDALVRRLLGSALERVTFIEADVSNAAGLEAALAGVPARPRDVLPPSRVRAYARRASPVRKASTA